MAALPMIARRMLGLSCVLLALAACGPKVASGVHDPNEEANRRTFEANLAIDRNLFSSSGRAEDGNDRGSAPEPLRKGLRNVSSNYALPGSVVNSALQGRLDRVIQNTARFAINTTIGIGGLFDAASVVNIPAAETDFGETLYVWGVGEGKFVMLPLVGPSTERHAVGRVADIFTNPLFWIVPAPERYIGPASRVLATGMARGENAELVEDVIYGSADPYAQVRLLYLENRRFRLGSGQASEDAYVDPYEDLYGE